MINIIKEILFWIATLTGSICIILLFICLLYRVFLYIFRSYAKCKCIKKMFNDLYKKK